MDWDELQNQLIESKYYYFHTENGVLLCGDCLEVMELIPEESVDLILTDPPYMKKYSHLFIELAKMGAEILKNNSFLICYASDYWFDITFPHMLNYLNFFFIFHLLLPGENALIFPRNIRVGAKSVIILMKGNAKPKRRIRNVVISPKREIDKCHMWQQSLEPFMFFVNNFSDDNDIILDPFLGSGTTAIACEKLNRRWIGIEINPEYCEIAKERILSVINDG